MKTLVAVVLVSVSLAGNAWGQSPRPQTAADLAKYLGADRERLLYEGAKEAKLVWYTSLTPYKEISKSFESRYPGVTVEPYRAPRHEPGHANTGRGSSAALHCRHNRNYARRADAAQGQQAAFALYLAASG